MQKPESIQDIETDKVILNLQIQTDHKCLSEDKTWLNEEKKKELAISADNKKIRKARETAGTWQKARKNRGIWKWRWY